MSGSESFGRTRGATGPNARAATDALSVDKRRLLDAYVRGRLGGARETPERILPRLPGAPVPLSFEQELIWIHSKLAPEVPLYNEILTVRRTGPLDVPALERSLEELVRRHEAWRTTFDEVGDTVVQVVQSPPRFTLPVCDLSGLQPSEREREAERVATKEATQPLDLRRGPLVRARLVRMNEGEHRLYVTLHQILHDGVSVYSVFLPELVALYEALSAGEPSPLPALDIQYGDYAVWQRKSTPPDTASLAYWRRQLAGPPDAVDLPTDRARPAVQTFRGGQRTFTVPHEVNVALKRIARAEGATPFATLLSAFKVLLHRYTAQDDIVVGTAVSTRRNAQVDGLLGVFLNTIVLRTTIRDAMTFRQVLGSVRQTTVEGLSHGDVPFHRLVRELQPRRDPGRNPLFQITFVLEPPMPISKPGWDMTQMDASTGVSRVDLYLQMDDRPDALVGHVRYNADLWDEATIALLVQRFQRLLAAVAADPDLPVSAIPIVAPNESLIVGRDARALRPTKEFVAFDAREIEQSIPRRFAQQVARFGDRVAVWDGVTRWTYAELDAASNRVAHAVAASHAVAEAKIALLLDHDAPMVAGVLGVSKSGAAYVPLDPSHPERRLRRIVEDAGAAAILTSRRHYSMAQALAPEGTALLSIEDVLQMPEAPACGADVPPERLAYLLYTSGSTGRPKGVAQSHRNVLHFIAAYTNNLHIASLDRLALLAPYGVDAAVMDIFGALLNGATLCPIDVRQGGLSGACQRLLGDGISIYHSTPTLFRLMARDLGGYPVPESVRLVVLGGEEVRSSDVALWRERFSPACVLVNGFGPTESTVSLQYFVDRQTPLETRSVPIGRPVDRTAVALLSTDGRPGQVLGEIAIRSPYVALGYWKASDLTAAAFRPASGGGTDVVYRTGDIGRLRPDGNIEFRGRIDLQTKIQGFRVELGEIEAAMLEHPDVREAAATVWESPEGEKSVVVHFVAADAAVPSPEELRRFLRSRLPAPMVAAAFSRLDAIPLTSSGKVDRRSLPPPERPPAPQASGDAADALERELVAIWREVLGQDTIGVRDDFFDRGGHSILALRMMAGIERRLGISLPLATLFEYPTIERLADALRSLAPPRAPISSRPGDAAHPARRPGPIAQGLVARLEAAWLRLRRP